MRDFGVGSEPEGLLWTGERRVSSGLVTAADIRHGRWRLHTTKKAVSALHVTSSASVVISSLTTTLLSPTSYRRQMAPPSMHEQADSWTQEKTLGY